MRSTIEFNDQVQHYERDAEPLGQADALQPASHASGRRLPQTLASRKLRVVPLAPLQHRTLPRLAKLALLAAGGTASLALPFESNVDRDIRMNAELARAGFNPVYESQCPPGVKGFFAPSLPKTGKPSVVVCTNNHEGAGEMSHTQAHEMAHAAQWCLAKRGLTLNDVVDITKLVIYDLRASREDFRQIHAQEMAKYKQDEAKCTQGIIPNKRYCENLPNLLKQKPAFEPPIVARADAGEKLSLVDLLDVSELREIKELYPPADRYIELEARAFAFLGRDAALKAIRAACQGGRIPEKK